MNNYCYMTLLTSDDYLDGVLLLQESLNISGTKYPLLCVCLNTLSEVTFEKLENFKLNYIVVDPIDMPDIIYEHNKMLDERQAEIWKHTLTKFCIWTFTEYDKIIFLDADLFILKNLDHCFEFDELTAAIDGEYFNLWPNNLHFNSGFMIIKPSIATFNSLLDFTYTIDPTDAAYSFWQFALIADQDILNIYFSDWKNQPDHQLNKYYNVFAPYILKGYEEDLINNCYFIHFVGLKPWQPEDFYKLDKFKNIRSTYYYCLAAAVIQYIEDNGMGIRTNDYLPTVTKLAFRVATEIVGDLSTANKFFGNEQDKKAEEVKPIVVGLLKQIYKDNVSNGAAIFNDLSIAECSNNEVILAYYKVIENAILTKFKNY